LTYRKEYALGLLSMLPLLAAGTSKGGSWLLTFIVVYVGIPLLTWSILVPRLALLVLKIVRHRESSGHQYFFEKLVGPPGFSRRILRDLRILLFIFVLSAIIVPGITQVTPDNLAFVSNEFIYVSILLLAIPSSIHVLLWVLEDSGFRCHNPARVTVTVPGSWMSKWLASIGGIGAFFSFAVALGGSLDRAVSLATTLLISLMPSSILAPTLFYRRSEPGIVKRIRESKAAIAMAHLFAPTYGPATPVSSRPSGSPR